VPLILWYKRIYHDLAIPQKEHAMVERISQPAFDFNRSVHLEVRPERITSDAGALLLRETMHKLRIDRWLGDHLVDFRREDDLVTHPWRELLRTKLILLCQGWRDNDDADFLRHDPALRLSVSDRRGDAALLPGPEVLATSGRKNPSRPHGLASQPTLSRFVDAVAAPEKRPGAGSGRRTAGAGWPPWPSISIPCPPWSTATSRAACTTATTVTGSTTR